MPQEFESAVSFIQAFEGLKVPLNEFKHADHVRLAWAYLQTAELPEATIRFRDALKRFAAHHGKSALYHETITFAFMFVINERAQINKAGSWTSFAALNGDLLTDGKGVLSRYYSADILASDRAKRSFVMPDRLA